MCKNRLSIKYLNNKRVGIATKLIGILILLSFFQITFPKRVFAYIDPGTGSYIIQILIATLLGVLFSIKLFWQRIRKFFTNIFSKDNNNKNHVGKKEK